MWQQEFISHLARKGVLRIRNASTVAQPRAAGRHSAIWTGSA